MLLKLKLAISLSVFYIYMVCNLVISYSLCKFQIWYNNVPHPKLVEYKKDQNWVRKSGNYFVFPGGGTQFKAGVTRYIRFIEQVILSCVIFNSLISVELCNTYDGESI
jgi:hypothetical protein